MKLPFLEQAIVPDAKLVKYLLDPSHPEGRSKAEFFLRLGFTREQPDILRRALLEVAAHTHMQEVIFPYGVKYTEVYGCWVAPNTRRQRGSGSHCLGATRQTATASARDRLSCS
jgi:hypothetical protein